MFANPIPFPTIWFRGGIGTPDPHDEEDDEDEKSVTRIDNLQTWLAGSRTH